MDDAAKVDKSTAVETQLDEHKEHRVEIKVNKVVVTLSNDDVTGQDVINAAIAQGVKIEPDFVLSLEVSPDKYQIIGKDERIEIHSGQKFRANVPDDNS